MGWPVHGLILETISAVKPVPTDTVQKALNQTLTIRVSLDQYLSGQIKDQGSLRCVGGVTGSCRD